jgi:phospholipid transport system substrate-binding protein
MAFRISIPVMVLTAAILFFFHLAPASAGEPAEQLRQTVDNVVAILRSPDMKGPAKASERRRKLREIVDARFDFSEMAKRALGSHWQRRSPEEQKEFVKLFTALLEGAYLETIESYNGEKVQYANERQDKTFAQVDTKVANAQGQEFAVDYRLHKVDGDWKVYDVIVENISLVNNYRSQFNRVLARSSYEELVSAMKEKKIAAPAVKKG